MKISPVISECDALAVVAFALDHVRAYHERRSEARFRRAVVTVNGLRPSSMDAQIGRGATREANRRAALVRASADALIAYRAAKGAQ